MIWWNQKLNIRRYILEINNIIAYYDKATEIGKMALKWKDLRQVFLLLHERKAVIFNGLLASCSLAWTPYKLLTCKTRVAYLFVVWLCNVYTKSAEEIDDFRVLSIGTREKLLKWGLTDR